MCGRHSPDLEIVGPHEDICQSLAHHVHNPLVKVLWCLPCSNSVLSSIYHTIDAFDLHVYWQTANVVLQWV